MPLLEAQSAKAYLGGGGGGAVELVNEEATENWN